MNRLLYAVIFYFLITDANAGCRSGFVDIQTNSGIVSFSIELADNFISRARGLMHRDVLPANAGMFFVCNREQSVSFWMKNTLIPLDIMFINATGRIVKIHENAKPYDLTPILSGVPVIAVLEINGGTTKRAWIKSENLVRHRSFPNLKWKCP